MSRSTKARRRFITRDQVLAVSVEHLSPATDSSPQALTITADVTCRNNSTSSDISDWRNRPANNGYSHRPTSSGHSQSAASIVSVKSTPTVPAATCFVPIHRGSTASESSMAGVFSSAEETLTQTMQHHHHHQQQAPVHHPLYVASSATAYYQRTASAESHTSTEHGAFTVVRSSHQNQISAFGNVRLRGDASDAAGSIVQPRSVVKVVSPSFGNVLKPFGAGPLVPSPRSAFTQTAQTVAPPQVGQTTTTHPGAAERRVANSVRQMAMRFEEPSRRATDARTFFEKPKLTINSELFYYPVDPTSLRPNVRNNFYKDNQLTVSDTLRSTRDQNENVVTVTRTEYRAAVQAPIHRSDFQFQLPTTAAVAAPAQRQTSAGRRSQDERPSFAARGQQQQPRVNADKTISVSNKGPDISSPMPSHSPNRRSAVSTRETRSTEAAGAADRTNYNVSIESAMTALETAISLLGAATAGVDGGTAAYGQPNAVESKGLITQQTQQARRHRGANGGGLDDVGGGVGGFGGDDEILRNTLKLFDSTIVAIDSAISVKGTVNHRSAFRVPAAAGTQSGGPVSSATAATNVNIPRNVSQVHNRRETNNNNNNNRRTHKKQQHQQPQQQQQQSQANWRNANNRYSAAQLADDLDKLVASCTFDKRQPTKVSLHERPRDDAPTTSVNRRSESPPVRRTLALPAESSIRRFRQRSKDRRRSSSSDSDTTQKRTRVRQRRSCRQRSASAGARCPPRDVRARRDRGDGSSSDSSTLNSDDEKALKPSVRGFTTSTTASAVSVTAQVTTSASTTPRNTSSDVIIYAHQSAQGAVRSPPRLTPSQREDVSSVDKSRMHVSVLEISRPASGPSLFQEATIIVPLPYGVASSAVTDLGTRISPTVIAYEPLNEAIAQLHSAPTVVVTATDGRENSNDEQTTSVTSSPSPAAVVEVVVQSAPVDVVAGRVAPPTIVAAVADSLVPETVLTVKETQRITVVISEPEIPEYVLTPVTSRDDQLNDTSRGTDNLSSSNNGSDVVQPSIAAGDPVTSPAMMTSLPTASLVAGASAISKAEPADATVGTDFDQHKELAAEIEKDESTSRVGKSVTVDCDDDDVTSASAPKNDVATETPQTTSTGVDGEQGKTTEKPGPEKKVVPESAVRGSSLPKVSSESRLTRPEVDEDQRPKAVGGSLSGTGIVRKHLIHLEKILHDDHGTPKDSKQRTARKAHTADLLSLGIRRHVSLSAVDRKHDKATTDDTSSSSCVRSKAGDSAVPAAVPVSLNCSTLVNAQTPSFPQVVLSPLST